MTDLCKRYGSVSVIEGLNLEIRDKEFMVLVGPSGCGKSTVLRMIAGLEDISEGTMKIGDRIVNDMHPKDRDVAMVFQSYALYPHMTVRENISFGLKVRKVPAAEIKKLVDEAATSLGLIDLLDRKPKALSGGQRQRVALGRAIVRKPSVFLFDEPLSNLDAELRVQMRAEISSLQKRLQITSVYVTHDQVEAMTMGHRITVLNGGDVQQVGTPLDLYETPRNLFVARFIGTPPMNIVAGTVKQDGSAVETATLVLPLEGELGNLGQRHRGRKIMVGLRPEHIGSNPEPEVPNAEISCKVEVVEPLGHEVILHGRSGEDRIVAKLHPHHIPETGETLKLSARCDGLHLFDPETELRLT
ncbi:sn-glycerol-3-phosphate ABC transporter ATP-binding protein UgpC [Sulfidibacter corallicola]